MPETAVVPPEEKPNHYTYLKSFRTEQCKEFLQHRCKQHRPYTCFHWHFPNQRRRRPIRKRDGSFNYSPNEYCAQYNESTGICPNGDSCPYLHRTNGDTERHYHLRYYKTEKCLHATANNGHCSKNGQHCMFAHGDDDLREPVYDVTVPPVMTMEHANSAASASVAMEKVTAENEQSYHIDPKWNDKTYMLKNYKTEPCPRWFSTDANRICRLGAMCPYYHSFKDKRRKLTPIKYRATACPMVKVKDEWYEASACDKGDKCTYCHTRMELQFHPDVYKSIKCDAMKRMGKCTKGIFCAFAHDDDGVASKEKLQEQVTYPTLSSSLSKNISDSVDDLSEIRMTEKTAAHVSELSAFATSNKSSGSFKDALVVTASSSEASRGIARETAGMRGLTNGLARDSTSVGSLQSDMAAMQLASNDMMVYGGAGVPAYAPLLINPSLMMSGANDPLEQLRQHQFVTQQGGTHFRPLNVTPLSDEFYGTATASTQNFNGSMSRLVTDDGRDVDHLDFDFQKDLLRHRVSSDAASSSHSASPMLSGTYGNSPMKGSSETESDGAKSRQHSDQSAMFQQQYLARLRMDLDIANRRVETADEEKRKLVQERDEALDQLAKYKASSAGGDSLNDGRYLRSLHPLSSLAELTVPLLQNIEKQLKSDLQIVREVVLQKSAGKCLNCLERNASLRLPVCHHKVLCEVCYMKTNECPTCQAAITIQQ